MSVSFENTATNRGVVTFTIGQDKIQPALDQAFNKVKKNLNVPGFRKGHIPRAVFNQKFGEEALYDDALNAILPAAYEAAIAELGLDVVKSKIEALGGDVEVKTKYGEGSTFSIRLPLTLAIIQALMVKVGEEKYAIALGSIETIEDVPVSEIKYVHAKEVINLRGNVIPLIRLRELLDVPGEPEESDNIVIVIVRKGDKLAGLVVDNLIGQMEIVIKSLGKYININRMISGATILGDGSVALIIDANTLV